MKVVYSYVWRSLVGSKTVVELGSRWKVGDGNNIRIYLDRWVKSLHGGKVRGREERGNEPAMVSLLITDSGGWNEELLDIMFHPREAAAIRRTPIREHGDMDLMSWKHEPLGAFSVRTAYLQQMKVFERGEGTSEEDMRFWNKLIWSNSIPPKAKVMLWKACNNFLATPGNLKLHHIPVDGTCMTCKDRWGSTEHTLFYCPKVKRGWKDSRFWWRIRDATILDFVSIAEKIRSEFIAEEYELWCLMVWKMWVHVCKRVHEGEDAWEEVTEASCWAVWEAYQAAWPTVGGPDPLGVKCGEKKWRKPRRGIFRVDVDAACRPEVNEFGVGVIIRDSEGKVVVAAARKTPPRSNVMLAEVTAVVSGIVLSVEYDAMPVEIFTDSLLVARIMAKQGEEADFLPEDIAEIIATARENILIGVKHMYRSANRAAHSLAQFDSRNSSNMVWTSMYPEWLCEIVEEEKDI